MIKTSSSTETATTASTMPMLYSSVPLHLTSVNSNGSRTHWHVSSLVNKDGLEHPNLSLLFIGCQSSGELISRSPQFPTNLSICQPFCLANSISKYVPGRSLRSTGEGTLSVPHTKTVIDAHAFQSAAPSIWNRLPADIRNSS